MKTILCPNCGQVSHHPEDNANQWNGERRSGFNRRQNRYGGRLWVKRRPNDRRMDVCGGRRVGWECRRVDRTRTLYIKKGLHGMETSRFEPAGMYEAMDGEVKPDRRIEQRRAPKIFGKKGRRNEGSDRRNK